MDIIDFPKKILIYTFLLSYLFLLIKNEENIVLKLFSSIEFASILTLLNQNLILVASDGIYYINKNELVNNKISNFTNPINTDELNEKTTMVQFSSEYDEYIIILAEHSLYFFEKDGTKIGKNDLPDSIDASHFCIIPYKKEENFLYYLIAYPVEKTFYLDYFKFNINSQYSNEIILSKHDVEINSIFLNNSIDKFVGVTCIFMINSFLDREILVCFYLVSHPVEIQARSFDPLNNFNELNNGFRYFIHNATLENFYSIIAKTNDEKKRHLFIILVNLLM